MHTSLSKNVNNIVLSYYKQVKKAVRIKTPVAPKGLKKIPLFYCLN